MKVRVKSPGIYQNAYRDRGDVLEVADGDFSETWMEKVEEAKAEEPKAEESERRQPDNQDEREAIEEQLQAEQITAQANKKKRSS